MAKSEGKILVIDGNEVAKILRNNDQTRATFVILHSSRPSPELERLARQNRHASCVATSGPSWQPVSQVA